MRPLKGKVASERFYYQIQMEDASVVRLMLILLVRSSDCIALISASISISVIQ